MRARRRRWRGEVPTEELPDASRRDFADQSDLSLQVLASLRRLPAEQRVVLVGDARVWQDENVVTGERITIYLAEDRQVVEAGKDERVKAVFYPRREGEETALPKPEPGAGCKQP